MIFRTSLMVLFIFICSCKYYSQNIEELQRAFVELRFGAFFHFGIMTFTGAPWATPNQDVNKFNPADLNCEQWADAMVSAGMKFGILTTKHHDGFCLWNSKYSENDVANSPWKNGKGDILQEFVTAMRSRNIKPCFYYSIWDNTKGVGNDTIDSADMDFIEGQLREILTNYGNISMLFIDGWSWKMGHKTVPYDKIRNLVKDLQPGCLLVDNTHLRCLYNNDLIHYEDGSPYPVNNRYPGIFSLKINRASGNDWFWSANITDSVLLSKDEILNNLELLEPQWCNFILNLPPNTNGQLDHFIVKRLEEAGKEWHPDYTRAQLPAQDNQNVYPITPVSAAAPSGNAEYIIDGFNDRYYYSVWESSAKLPQSVTIDLGREYEDVNLLAYVPKYQTYIDPRKEGSIKKYKIYKSTDNIDFIEVASGEWNGDNTMKIVIFPEIKTRYIRLEAITAENNFAAATEIAIGKKKNKFK